MNKLTIEEKKKLAEKVHGWKTDYIIFEYRFNPDQDLTQFVAMIGALGKRLRCRIAEYLCDDSRGLSYCDNTLEDFIWLCKHKYEVCRAVKWWLTKKQHTF